MPRYNALQVERERPTGKNHFLNDKKRWDHRGSKWPAPRRAVSQRGVPESPRLTVAGPVRQARVASRAKFCKARYGGTSPDDRVCVATEGLVFLKFHESGRPCSRAVEFVHRVQQEHTPGRRWGVHRTWSRSLGRQQVSVSTVSVHIWGGGGRNRQGADRSVCFRVRTVSVLRRLP